MNSWRLKTALWATAVISAAMVVLGLNTGDADIRNSGIAALVSAGLVGFFIRQAKTKDKGSLSLKAHLDGKH